VAGVTDGHLVVSALEHPSVSRPIAELELRGFEVTRVRPDTRGVIDPDEVRAAVRPETRLVAVMLVNNELGTVQPVAEIGRLCRVAEVPLLCDAVQATGKMPLRATDLQADFVSVSAHKCNGPLGAAALIVDSASELSPRSWGGSQERRRRAGTENVPALVGMGQAAELIEIELTQRCEHLATLRDAFEEELLVAVHGVTILGRSAERVGNTTSLCISGVDAQALAIRLDLAGFAVSPGAACASGLVEPSATLLALGLDREAARGTLRISFGVTNRVDEVRRFVPSLIAAIESLRGTPARSLEEVRV
jgi:cysteine desulfurase